MASSLSDPFGGSGGGTSADALFGPPPTHGGSGLEIGTGAPDGLFGAPPAPQQNQQQPPANGVQGGANNLFGPPPTQTTGGGKNPFGPPPTNSAPGADLFGPPPGVPQPPQQQAGGDSSNLFGAPPAPTQQQPQPPGTAPPLTERSTTATSNNQPQPLAPGQMQVLSMDGGGGPSQQQPPPGPPQPQTQLQHPNPNLPKHPSTYDMDLRPRSPPMAPATDPFATPAAAAAPMQPKAWASAQSTPLQQTPKKTVDSLFGPPPGSGQRGPVPGMPPAPQTPQIPQAPSTAQQTPSRSVNDLFGAQGTHETLGAIGPGTQMGQEDNNSASRRSSLANSQQQQQQQQQQPPQASQPPPAQRQPTGLSNPFGGPPPAAPAAPTPPAQQAQGAIPPGQQQVLSLDGGSSIPPGQQQVLSLDGPGPAAAPAPAPAAPAPPAVTLAAQQSNASAATSNPFANINYDYGAPAPLSDSMRQTSNATSAPGPFHESAVPSRSVSQVQQPFAPTTAPAPAAPAAAPAAPAQLTDASGKQPHGRPACAKLDIGNGGKCAISGGKIMKLESLVNMLKQGSAHASMAELEGWPGPLGPNVTPEKLTAALQYVSTQQGRCQQENNSKEKLMWDFLEVCINQKGQLGSSAFKAAILPVLLAAAGVSEADAASGSPLHQVLIKVATGNLEPAIHEAVRHGLWTHAVILSGMFGQEANQHVLGSYSDSDGLNKEPGASQLAGAFKVLCGCAAMRPDIPISEELLANWPATTAMVFAICRQQPDNELTPPAAKFLVRFGHELAQRGDAYGAHINYLLTLKKTLEPVDNPATVMAVLGVDHRGKDWGQLLSSKGLHMSEVFEFAQRVGNPNNKGIASLQTFKFAYCQMLLDMGMERQAKEYMQVIATFVRNSPSTKYSDQFRKALADMEKYRLGQPRANFETNPTTGMMSDLFGAAKSAFATDAPGQPQPPGPRTHAFGQNNVPPSAFAQQPKQPPAQPPAQSNPFGQPGQQAQPTPPAPAAPLSPVPPAPQQQAYGQQNGGQGQMGGAGYGQQQPPAYGQQQQQMGGGGYGQQGSYGQQQQMGGGGHSGAPGYGQQGGYGQQRQQPRGGNTGGNDDLLVDGIKAAADIGKSLWGGLKSLTSNATAGAGEGEGGDAYSKVGVQNTFYYCKETGKWIDSANPIAHILAEQEANKPKAPVAPPPTATGGWENPTGPQGAAGRNQMGVGGRYVTAPNTYGNAGQQGYGQQQQGGYGGQQGGYGGQQGGW